MHVFTQNVCEDKSRRSIAKSDFPFIDNSLLEQCQNKRITMGKPDGFIEIEVGETFFDVLKALLARFLSSLLQVLKIVLQIMYFFLSADVLTLSTNRSLYLSQMSLHIPPLFSVDERFKFSYFGPHSHARAVLFPPFRMHFPGSLEFICVNVVAFCIFH